MCIIRFFQKRKPSAINDSTKLSNLQIARNDLRAAVDNKKATKKDLYLAIDVAIRCLNQVIDD